VDLARNRMWVRGKGGKRLWVALSNRLAADLAELAHTTGGAPERTVLGIAYYTVSSIIAALCRRAGVPHRGYHALRHSAACGLYRGTQDLGVVQRHLRHASINTTRIYASLDDARYSEAVSSMGQAA